MKTYTVTLKEFVKTEYTVKAESPDEAIEKAQKGEYEIGDGIVIKEHIDTKFGNSEAKEIK